MDTSPSVIYMQTKELLQRVLKFSSHKHNCDALQVNWHKGPCDCGWEELEKELEQKGILPPTKKCEHCGIKVGQADFDKMDTCIHCGDLLCESCLDTDGPMCDKNITPNSNICGPHERSTKKKFPGGPGGAHTTYMPGEDP